MGYVLLTILKKVATNVLSAVHLAGRGAVYHAFI